MSRHSNHRRNRGISKARRLLVESLERREMLTSIPVALNDPLYSTALNTTLTISSAASGVRNNDFDAEGTTLSLSVVSGPANGSLTTFNTDGTFTYVPNSSFTGIDTFTYKASDGTNDSNIATVSIAVGGNFGPRTNLDEVPLDAMLLTGGLTLSQPLTMGHELIYRSDTVNPHPLIVLETSLLSSSSVPDQIDAELTFNGNSQGTVEYDTTGLAAGDPLRFVLQADASSLATGYYNYSVELTAWFGSTPVSRTYSGSQAVVNRTTSEFGAGWWLAGLDELAISGSNALLVKANGDALWFAGNGSGGYLKAAGDLDHSTLVKNVDNTFTLTSKYGDETNFGTTGLLTSRVDTNGNTVTFTHTSGVLTEIVDPFSRDTDLTYTSGLLTSFEDLANRASTLAYSSSKLTSVTLPDPDAGGSLAAPVYEFAYNATTALLETAEDPLNNDTTFAYDETSFRLDTITHPDSNVWNLDPIQPIGLASGTGNSLTSPADAIGQITDERSMVWEFTTDWYGNLTTWTDPLDNTTQWERDASGRVFRLTEPDPDGSGSTYMSPITKFGYSAVGNLVLEVLPDNSDRSYTWNSLSRMLTFTDERNKTWTNTFDSNGNLETSEDPLSNETSFLYTLAGFVRSITTPDPDAGGSQTAATTEIDYDAYGRIELITLPDLSEQAFAYNTADRLTTFTDELLNEWTQTWDALDRLTSSTNPENETTSFSYNAASQLIETVDPLGKDTDYAYNSRGWLTTITMPDPDGAGSLTRLTNTFTYDATGNRVGFEDPLTIFGSDIVATYDDAGRLTSQGVTNGLITEYEYDKLGRVTKTTDNDSRYTKYEYNSRNWVVTVIQSDPTSEQLEDGPETSFTYNASGQLLTETNARGYTTTHAYDDRGLLTQTTLADPDGAGSLASPVYAYGYDNAARLTSVTDPLSNVTAHAYDNRDRLLSVTGADPDGGGSATAPVTEYGYDDASRLTSITDPLDRVTTIAYDDAHRRTSLTLPDPDGAGSLTSPVYAWAYNDAGSLTSATDPLGNVTTFAYDAMQRLTSRTDPDPDGGGSLTAPVTTFVYSSGGKLSKITDALSHDTTFGYDSLGRQSTVTNHQGKITTTTWDTFNRVTGVETPDPDGEGSESSSTTTYDYDRLDRLVKITDPLAGETTFTHDAVGNLLTLTDAEENTTTWAYDGLNRVTSETNELNDARSFVYNVANLLTQKTDRNGRVVEYAYDNLHRLTTETWKTGGNTVRTLNYAFDAANQLTSTSDPAAEYLYSYDAIGRLTGEEQDIDGLTPDIEYVQTWNAASRRLSLAAEIGGTADFKNDFVYDNLQRLTRITQQDVSGGNVVADKRIDIAYSAVGLVTSLTRYQSTDTSELVVTSELAYDSLNRLTALDHKRNSTILAAYDYGYDFMNRLTSIDSSVEGLSSFTYDAASQLTAGDHASGGAPDESYSFDSTGNRTMTGYTVTANNRTTSDGTYNYEYDDEGNRTKRTKISTGAYEEYTWDHRNRLTLVTFKNSSHTTLQTVAYAYDTFNRLVRRTHDADGPGSGAATDQFWSFPSGSINPALEFDGSSASDLTHRYLFNPAAVDQILADEAVTSLSSAGNVLWPLPDHLGTPRDIADYDASTDTTTVTNHRTYNAFGVRTAETNSAIDLLFGFTGKPFDETTGGQNNWHRIYDAALGRWLSQDQVGYTAGDFNLFRYAENDPVNLVDPTGLADLPGWLIIRHGGEIVRVIFLGGDGVPRQVWEGASLFEGIVEYNEALAQADEYFESLAPAVDALPEIAPEAADEFFSQVQQQPPPVQAPSNPTNGSAGTANSGAATTVLLAVLAAELQVLCQTQQEFHDLVWDYHDEVNKSEWLMQQGIKRRAKARKAAFLRGDTAYLKATAAHTTHAEHQDEMSGFQLYSHYITQGVAAAVSSVTP